MTGASVWSSREAEKRCRHQQHPEKRCRHQQQAQNRRLVAWRLSSADPAMPMEIVSACSTALFVLEARLKHDWSKSVPRKAHSTAEIPRLCTNNRREPRDVRTPCPTLRCPSRTGAAKCCCSNCSRPCLRGSELKNAAERVWNGYSKLSNVGRAEVGHTGKTTEN